MHTKPNGLGLAERTAVLEAADILAGVSARQGRSRDGFLAGAQAACLRRVASRPLTVTVGPEFVQEFTEALKEDRAFHSRLTEPYNEQCRDFATDMLGELRHGGEVTVPDGPEGAQWFHAFARDRVELAWAAGQWVALREFANVAEACGPPAGLEVHDVEE